MGDDTKNSPEKELTQEHTGDTNRKEERLSIFSSLLFKFFILFLLVGLFPFGTAVYLLTSGYEKLLKDLFSVLATVAPQTDVGNLLVQLHDFRIQSWLVISTLAVYLIGASITISYFLSRPIKKLLGYLKGIALGDLRTVITAETRDEVGQLAQELKTTVEHFVNVRERDKAISTAKNEFISITAHQLRSPLTTIKWSLKELLEEETFPLRSRAMLKNSYETADRMIRLIGNFLDVVRIEEGRFGFTFQLLDIAPIIQKVAHEFRSIAEIKNITIDVILPPTPLPPVFVDPDGVTIVLTNLVSNAVNYTPARGLVAVAARVDPYQNHLEISVQDSGIGIPENQMGRIFSKFFRASNALRLQPDGSGLGLFVVKSIIDRHRGVIRVESKEGKGTLFVFTLPLLEKDLPKNDVTFEGFFEGIGRGKENSSVERVTPPPTVGSSRT